jgi:hypothetical protein
MRLGSYSLQLAAGGGRHPGDSGRLEDKVGTAERMSDRGQLAARAQVLTFEERRRIDVSLFDGRDTRNDVLP